MPPFRLFTSIKPPTSASELAYISDCINSWRAAGFTAISINGPGETESLRKLGIEIDFAPLPYDGKPRIGAIFSAIHESGVRFSGIINADCRIVRYPGLAASLMAGLDRTIALAWRIDLGPDQKPTTRRGGFDAFFFDTGVIPPDDGGFSIADPWWDYWFPFACEMNGARVETLRLPLLTHKYHPENWTEQSFIDAGRRVWLMLQRWHQRGDLPKSLLARIPDGLTAGRTPDAEQLRRLVGVPPFWLYDCRPQTMALMSAEAAEIETMLRFGGHALFHEVRFAEREAIFAAYETMRNSTCWRMTAPLRQAVTAARRINAASQARWSEVQRWFRPAV